MVKLKNCEGGRIGGEWGGKKQGEMFRSTLSNNFSFSLTEAKQTHVLSVPLNKMALAKFLNKTFLLEAGPEGPA